MHKVVKGFTKTVPFFIHMWVAGRKNQICLNTLGNKYSCGVTSCRKIMCQLRIDLVIVSDNTFNWIGSTK